MTLAKEEVGTWLEVEVAGSVNRLLGQLFHYDDKMKMVVLMEPIVPAEYESMPAPVRPAIHHTTHLIAMDSIKAYRRLATAPNSVKVDLPTVKPIRTDRLRRRELRTLQKRQELFGSRAPHGASSEALAVFAALAKTLPCYWRPNEGSLPTIVVLEEVLVCAPYYPSSCRGTIKSSPALVERVRKVLHNERLRLGLSNEEESK